MLKSICTALIPVPVFYFIYFRHFISYYRSEGKSPAYLKHLESFLFGIALALSIIIAAPWVDRFFQSGSIFSEAFFKAALIEKIGALAVIILIQRNYPAFNILEAIVSGILVGAGFSLVENVFYAMNYGHTIIMVRVFFSVPLHLTTCGLLGYFIGASKLSAAKFNKVQNMVRGLGLSLFFHTLFDLFLLSKGMYVYCIGPLVIIIIGMLELFIAHAKNIPSRSFLSEEGLRLEDWFIKYRQPRYERWILNSMGSRYSAPISFFKAHRGLILWVIALFSVSTGIGLFPFVKDITVFLNLVLPNEEQILLISVYPISIGISVLMVGSINPAFFTSSVMRLPIIFDAVLCRSDGEENLVTFDVSMTSCLLRTFEPLAVHDDTTIYFESKYFRSPRVHLRLKWENHQQNRQNEPTGSIVEIIDPGIYFYVFLFRYYLFRLRKGIIFNLKLPGFRQLRRLFMRPITVMQKEIVCQPGATVFKQGDSVQSFYYIKKGKVNIYKELDSGDRILLESMEAGQIFNEMALLGNTRRTVTVQCQTQCVLAQARADNLDALIRNNPDFASALVRKLARRADQTQNDLAQTIDYLQKLLQIKSRRAKNAALLLAELCGLRVDGSVLKLELDAKNIGARINASPGDILHYLNQSLSLTEGEKNIAAQDASDAT